MTQAEMNPTIVVATIQPKMLSRVTEQLRNTEGITYYSPLAGRFNLAIELKVAEPEKVHELVEKIRSIDGITSTGTYIPYEGFAKERKGIYGADSLALVLMQVRGRSQKVLKLLEQEPQIQSAFAVPGEFDIIATVSGKNHEEVLSQVSKVAEVEGVRTSETLLAYKPMWQ
jgi:DNA-binding Lrp family transcriptional regulator